MLEQMMYAVADPDFYAPLEAGEDGTEQYSPTGMPADWAGETSGFWRVWRRTGQPMAHEGWKVHISATADRVPAVLDVFAGGCVRHEVPFKHVRSQRFLSFLQHKHASRTQSGKLMVAYPPDEAASRALMRELADLLADEHGQYILTDRRFADSKVVHYRYGSFTRRARLKPDGSVVDLVGNGHGELVPDLRDPAFRLPDGITDPFAAAADEAGQELSFHGFAFESAIAHSNAGGAYLGREVATGRKVFIKEARAHTGLTWDGRTGPERLRLEWETLQTIHSKLPGVCPEPIAYFTEWEHEFLVTEFVEGTTLNSWVVANSPVIEVDADADAFAHYYRRCGDLVTAVADILDRLHDAGYVFVDVSPRNILVPLDGPPRLIDFEAASAIGEQFTPIGTENYTPPRGLVGDDPTIFDDYGLSALVQLMLGPIFEVAAHNPGAMDHVYADLAERAAPPDALWRRAVKYLPATAEPRLPGPDDVARAPREHLGALRDQVADALMAMADPDHPLRVFPTVPEGYGTNTVCVAFGTAGVLHALHRCGIAVPAAVLDRFRADSLAAAPTLAPGLHAGLAGICWVLAELGFVAEAVDLIRTADAHPLTHQCATFAGGAAGVAMTHLALYGHTGEAAHVDRARLLLDALPTGDALIPALGPDEATGWLHGRAGIALALYHLALLGGEPRHLTLGTRMLHHELDRTADPDDPGLLFPISRTDRRRVPYLFAGTAGLLRVVARYTRAVGDERLHAALPRLVPRLRTTYTVMPGLYQGISGLGFALAEYASLGGPAALHDDAVRVGRALFKYAVPHDTGVRFLGDQGKRASADLWSGSAGILLFLDQLANPRPDSLFTLDPLLHG